ncbi:MAG: hypothetical protein ABR562_04670 [Thermoplasmatota archaeon]
MGRAGWSLAMAFFLVAGAGCAAAPKAAPRVATTTTATAAELPGPTTSAPPPPETPPVEAPELSPGFSWTFHTSGQMTSSVTGDFEYPPPAEDTIDEDQTWRLLADGYGAGESPGLLLLQTHKDWSSLGIMLHDASVMGIDSTRLYGCQEEPDTCPTTFAAYPDLSDPPLRFPLRQGDRWPVTLPFPGFEFGLQAAVTGAGQVEVAGELRDVVHVSLHGNGTFPAHGDHRTGTGHLSFQVEDDYSPADRFLARQVVTIDESISLPADGGRQVASLTIHEEETRQLLESHLVPGPAVDAVGAFDLAFPGRRYLRVSYAQGDTTDGSPASGSATAVSYYVPRQSLSWNITDGAGQAQAHGVGTAITYSLPPGAYTIALRSIYDGRLLAESRYNFSIDYQDDIPVACPAVITPAAACPGIPFPVHEGAASVQVALTLPSTVTSPGATFEVRDGAGKLLGSAPLKDGASVMVADPSSGDTGADWTAVVNASAALVGPGSVTVAIDYAG